MGEGPAQLPASLEKDIRHQAPAELPRQQQRHPEPPQEPVVRAVPLHWEWGDSPALAGLPRPQLGHSSSPLMASLAPLGWPCGRAGAEAEAGHKQGWLRVHQTGAGHQAGRCRQRGASGLPPPQPCVPWAHQQQPPLPAKGDLRQP